MKKERLTPLAAALVLLLCAFVCAPAQSRSKRRAAPRAAASPAATTAPAGPAKKNARETAQADTAADENAPAKKNAREAADATPPGATTPAAAGGDANGAPVSAKVQYVYDFKQPGAFLQHIRIEHDAAGRGRITFERNVDTEELTDPLELSPESLRRIKSHWEALRFLDSEAVYQTERQFTNLGTTRLQMTAGPRTRSAEFNWTHDADAKALAKEYRNAAEQVLLVFEINLSLENQPLELPKLLTRFERLLEIDGLSDPPQLAPLLRSLENDERVPLIARNHAVRLLKKLDKAEK